MRHKFFNFSLALIILFSTNSLTAKSPKAVQEEQTSDLDICFANKLVQAFHIILDNKFYSVFQLMEGLEILNEYSIAS